MSNLESHSAILDQKLSGLDEEISRVGKTAHASRGPSEGLVDLCGFVSYEDHCALHIFFPP